jgi:hypothetical protein
MSTNDKSLVPVQTYAIGPAEPVTDEPKVKEVNVDPAVIAFLAALALIVIAAIVGIVIAIAKEQNMKRPGT